MLHAPSRPDKLEPSIHSHSAFSFHSCVRDDLGEDSPAAAIAVFITCFAIAPLVFLSTDIDESLR